MIRSVIAVDARPSANRRFWVAAGNRTRIKVHAERLHASGMLALAAVRVAKVVGTPVAVVARGISALIAQCVIVANVVRRSFDRFAYAHGKRAAVFAHACFDVYARVRDDVAVMYFTTITLFRTAILRCDQRSAFVHARTADTA